MSDAAAPPATEAADGPAARADAPELMACTTCDALHTIRGPGGR